MYLSDKGKLSTVTDYMVSQGFKQGHKAQFEAILNDAKKEKQTCKYFKVFHQVYSALKANTKVSYSQNIY